MTDLMQFYQLLKEQHNDVSHDWWPTVSKNKRFETMVGCILTQNTAWTNVEKAIENLYQNDLLQPEKIRKVNIEELKDLVRPSGYYNQKAKRLKRLAHFLEEYSIQDLLDMHVEKPRKLLLKIKGVGQETADSILLYALDKPIFVIDAYTKRIVSRWGLIPEDISYEKLQKFFMDNLRRDVNLYKEYHALLVEHAKSICTIDPLCEACKLFEVCEKNI